MDPWLAVTVPAGAAALLAYSAGVRRVRRVGGTWPGWRQVALTAGVLLCAAGVAAPLPERFSTHVLEHVLLGMAGPALIAAAAPLTLLARACPARYRASVRRALRSPVAAFATHPVAALGFAALGPWALWLTPLNDWQLEHDWVHALVHAHLFVSGVAFGVAILGLDHSRWRRRHATRLFGAALALPMHTLLGLVLLSAAKPYLNPGMDPVDGLDDQRFGAAMLWVVGDGLATAAIVVIVAQWIAAERRAAARTVAVRPTLPVQPTPAATRRAASGRIPPAANTATSAAESMRNTASNR